MTLKSAGTEFPEEEIPELVKSISTIRALDFLSLSFQTRNQAPKHPTVMPSDCWSSRQPLESLLDRFEAGILLTAGK